MSVPFPVVRVERSYRFIASHHLPKAGKSEARVHHEHVYKLVVILEHEVNPTVNGWAMDFDNIDEDMQELLDKLEGSNLNELLPFQPTSEMLACWCVANTKPFITGIRIEETNRSSSTALRKDIKPEWMDRFRE